jgi:L-erythro-3,5-diaminohexanoate dehydrogenase
MSYSASDLSSYRPADALGLQRVVGQSGILPQQAEKIDPALPLAEDELLVEVESLNIDSASFHQISQHCGGDLARIQTHILELVAKRGKHHNPVTGSGGMFIGRVVAIGPKFPLGEKPVKVGDRIASLVSLSLTPLEIRKIKQIHPHIDRVDVEGHAILFASGLFARLPEDLPDTVSLAVLDVAGAPAQTRALTREGDTVVVIGGGGKSGLLCLFEAKQKQGVQTIAIEYSQKGCEKLRALTFVDQVIQADARDAVAVMKAVQSATGGKKADLVINVANIPETEMASILACKNKGIVYFFSMATSFTRAALGAEGVGADVDLRIGNGYTEGHADLALSVLRRSPEIRGVFEQTYSSSSG